MKLNPLVLQIIGSWVRAGLTLVSGFLIQKHIVTAAQGESLSTMLIDQITNSIPAIAAIVWSMWHKYASRSKLMTALMLGGTTEDAVTTHIDSGAVTPTVLTPPATVPGVPDVSTAPKP